jgi:hypothetical protein
MNTANEWEAASVSDRSGSVFGTKQQHAKIALLHLSGLSSPVWFIWGLSNSKDFKSGLSYGYGSLPINTIFRGMNIHLPAILMFTRGTRFDTLPYLFPIFNGHVLLVQSPHV